MLRPLKRRISSALSNAAELSWERYQRGLEGIFNTLETRRRAFEAESRFLSLKKDRILNRINLYLAIGMNEILPKRIMISPRRNGMSMVEPYEYDNPMTLLFGRMDFVFFVTIIMPLLLIALNFDVIASDRARGLYKMLLSNPLTESSIIMNRMLARSGLLLVIVMVALIYGLMVAENVSITAATAWIILVGAYFLFWFGLIFLLVGRSKKGAGLSKIQRAWRNESKAAS